MTTTPILALSDFANLLDYTSVSMDIDYFQEDSGRTGAGEDIVTDMGDPVWRGEITLNQQATHAEAAGYQALVALLNGAIGRFVMHDPRLPFPIADPDGSLMGSADPKILNINGNRDQVKFQDLPGGYQLTLGDRFHIEFGADPVHRTFHYVCTTIAAAGGGSTDWVTIRPNLPVGINIGDSVDFKRPSPIWRLVSGSKKAGTGQGKLTPGPTWQMVQVF